MGQAKNLIYTDKGLQTYLANNYVTVTWRLNDTWHVMWLGLCLLHRNEPSKHDGVAPSYSPVALRERWANFEHKPEATHLQAFWLNGPNSSLFKILSVTC